MSFPMIRHYSSNLSKLCFILFLQFLTVSFKRLYPKVVRSSDNTTTILWNKTLFHNEQRTNNKYQLDFEMLSAASFKKNQQHHRLLSSCVRNQNELITVIQNTPYVAYTKIDVCSEYMTIDARQTNMGSIFQGIFLNHKTIYFSCRLRNKCILDAQGLSRHFYGLVSNITFENFVFINGNGYNDSSLHYFVGTGSGGALFFDYSLLTLIRCDVVNNEARLGGGIFLYKSNLFMYGDNNASTPSLFENNVAGTSDVLPENRGGVICCYLLSNVTTMSGYFLFRNNHAGYAGGVIFSQYPSNVIVTNVVFRNNSASIGGAFHGAGLQGGFKDVVFHSNSATDGAAIYQESGGTLQLDNVTMLNNTGNGMIYMNSGRVDARRLSMINSFEHSGGSDVILGTTVWISRWNPQSGGWETLDGMQYSVLNLPLSPPNRMQTRRDREQASFEENEESLQHRSLRPCVFTATSLQNRVSACDHDVTGGSCIISICAKVIRIPNHKSPTKSSNASGIDLTNKRIKLVCRQTQRRCVLDGQGLSRIFYGTNASIIFRNIVFANGYDNDAGGAIMMQNGSDVSLWDCSFINNTASFGSAIAIYGTSMVVGGQRTTFVNNNGATPPLYSNSSTVDITDTIFAQNNATLYGGGGVMIFNSKIDLYNVTFSNRSNNQPEDCALYYVFDSRNFSNGANCFNVLDPN